MIVSMWMARNLIMVPITTTINQAAVTMTEKRIRRLPVVETSLDGSRLLGIVTSMDLYRAFPADINPFAPDGAKLPPSTVTVGDIMLRTPATTTPDAPIEEAARIMRDRKVGALPVLRKEALVGLITESDIFRAFVAIFESPKGGVRVTFDVSEGEDIYKYVGDLATKRRSRVVGLITSRQDGKPVCVVRLAGGDIDPLLDDLWKSGHKVLNVLRM